MSRNKRPKGPQRPKAPPPKESLVDRETALASLGEYLEEFGYDALIHSPKVTSAHWIVTLWAHEEPGDRACSSARSLSAALNDVVDQLRRPHAERFGVAPSTGDDDDDDDEDDDDFEDFESIHQREG